MRIGDYRIERELATEETDVVYLGLHAVLPRQAAVKVVRHDAGRGKPERAKTPRVLREARVLESLSHPGIPRVFECGTLPDGRLWAAFERIDGVTLESQLAAAPISVAELVMVLRDVGDLLAHAHARGVVHRRLTADAIVRTPDRGYSVCVRHWHDGRILDTEARSAPDAMDDVHALGVVVSRALSGATAADLVAPLAARGAEADFGSMPRARRPSGPTELGALIEHMLAADPAERPPADEVRDRARWLADTYEPRMSDRLRWTPANSLTTDSIPPSSPSRSEATGLGRRRRRGTTDRT
jgi:serine/threonine protein kinase